MKEMSSFERQSLILDIIIKHGTITISDIVKRFSISEATARRDLEALAAKAKIRRVHGGAIALREAPPEPPILQREILEQNEKQRIGRAAAGLIENNQTVFLGSGTTVLELARNLRTRDRLNVITNSLPVLNTLSGLPGINVVALGGSLRKSELSFIGHITEQALAEVRADLVFIGVRGISLENGLTNDFLPETMTDRAIMNCGREVVVLADHTKINAFAPAYLAPITAIHRFITDTESPKEFLSALDEVGVSVLCV